MVSKKELSMTADRPNAPRPGARQADRLDLSGRWPGPARCVLAIAGEVDLATAPALKAELGRTLAAGAQDLVLDISRVTHLDSTGLAVLVGLRRRLGQGRRVAIAAAPALVIELLRLTGLDGIFDIFASVDDALAYLDVAGQNAGEVPLSPDAALALGLATSALPFTESPTGEAECWARILLTHGGQTLMPDAPDSGPPQSTPANEGNDHRADARWQERLDRVVSGALRIAQARGGSSVRTGDVLRGVLAVYGVAFERELHAHHGVAGVA
jgi:anti-sigma B factor antagonist